jgi:hypothetical protein
MAILRIERPQSQPRQLPLLPCGERIAASQSRLPFFDGVLNRDVPELGPLVDLAAPVGILHGPRKWMLGRNHPPVASSLPVVLYENETSRIYLPHR